VDSQNQGKVNILLTDHSTKFADRSIGEVRVFNQLKRRSD